MIKEVQYYVQYEKSKRLTLTLQSQVNKSDSFCGNEIKIEDCQFQPKQFTIPREGSSYDTTIIQRICNKYFITISQDDLSRMLMKIQKIRQSEPTKKIVPQTLAAVLFIEYLDKFPNKMTKQFCKRNNLNTRHFNEGYKIYHNLFLKGSKFTVQSNSDVKKQEYIQERNNKMILKRVQGRKQIYLPDLNDPFDAICSVYDDIFKSNYYQSNRRQIIQKLVDHYNYIDPSTLSHFNERASSTQKTFYLLFYLLKDLKHQMPFHAFRAIAKERVNILLKKQLMTEIFKTIRGLQRLKQLKLQQQQSIRVKIEHF